MIYSEGFEKFYEVTVGYAFLIRGRRLAIPGTFSGYSNQSYTKQVALKEAEELNSCADTSRLIITCYGIRLTADSLIDLISRNS